MPSVSQIAEKFYLKFAPASQRSAFLHKKARKRFYHYVRKQAGARVVEVEPGPVGNAEIIMRTAVLADRDAKTKLNSNYYFRSGYGTMLHWLKHLDQHGFQLGKAKAIMELGCGSARLIRHLRCLKGVELVGSDVMPEFIEWCRANVPGVSFHVNALQPPLTFAASNHFDLIFAQSVFTHIPLDVQGAWIEELHRVIRPGGYLAATVLGEYHQAKMLSAAEREQLARDGHYTLTAESSNASISTQLIGSWDVFQTRAEVMRVFGQHFQACDYIPGQLDLLILKKIA